MRNLNDYKDIVGDKIIHEIYKKASRLLKYSILNINSTNTGGGVAEILKSFLPLINSTGLRVDWRLLHGNSDFFKITKKIHNGLQGDNFNLSVEEERLYYDTIQEFASYANFNNYDLIVIHDPQPMGLINYMRKQTPWIFRCHIDISKPDEEIWQFIKNMILKYDLMIVSDKMYLKDIPVEQKVIAPVIDPLSTKNYLYSKEFLKKYLKKYDIPSDKPFIVQISRFDKFKDPEGVVEIFLKLRKKFDIRLILCGSMASDDPEGKEIYENVKRRADKFIKNRDIILITAEDNLLVNALQTLAEVVIQKSLKEGFGLVVTEALWKKNVVVGSNVGGIPLQIIDRETGFLVPPDDIDGFVEVIEFILKNPSLKEKIGIKAHEFVKKNFLITRLIDDYLNIYNELLYF